MCDLYIFLFNFQSTQTARRNRVYLTILKHYSPLKAFSKSGTPAHLAEVAFKIKFSITCASYVHSNKNHVFVIPLTRSSEIKQFLEQLGAISIWCARLFVGCIDMYGNRVAALAVLCLHCEWLTDGNGDCCGRMLLPFPCPMPTIHPLNV